MPADFSIFASICVHLSRQPATAKLLSRRSFSEAGLAETGSLGGGGSAVKYFYVLFVPYFFFGLES